VFVVVDVVVAGLAGSVPVRLTGPRVVELASAFEAAWDRCLVSSVEGREAPGIVLSLDEPGEEPPGSHVDSLIRDSDLPTLLVRATQAITGALISAQRGNLLMFHAGAASHPSTGASVVYVAPGGTGKTTLSRVLGAQYGYLTDECVGLDEENRIYPYPKPLSLRVPGLVTKQETSPTAFGLVGAHPDPRLRTLVLLNREPGAVTPRAERLGLVDAMVALAPQTSSLSSLNKGLHRMADLIDSVGGVVRWDYAEADDLTPHIAAGLEEVS
jgi:hypothetical protein